LFTAISGLKKNGREKKEKKKEGKEGQKKEKPRWTGNCSLTCAAKPTNIFLGQG